mmetsp:Transcript_10117/g.8867  ORF Transcript_10117/g.8867 Transcript_10117/m.8867 type:complete len:144 (-) Transcript_10117:1236-1667(-)
MLDMYGKDIFDKNLSAEEALKKKDLIKIAQEQQQLADEAALLNSENAEGGSIEQVDALKFELKEIAIDLKARLEEIFGIDIEGLALKSCGTVKKNMDIFRDSPIVKPMSMTDAQLEILELEKPQMGALPIEAEVLTRLIKDVV